LIFKEINELNITGAVGPNRYGTTLANIHLDGTSIYGAEILSRKKLYSGGSTVGAFENSDPKTLVAWIDSSSSEFLTLRPHFFHSILGISILTVLLSGFVISVVSVLYLYLGIKIFRYSAFNSSVALMGLSTGLLYLCIKSVSKMSVLERKLRAEFNNKRLKSRLGN
jgi:hypothetical protein